MVKDINLQVLEQDRDGFSRVTEIKIGKKTITTPCFTTLIQNSRELDLFLNLKLGYAPSRLGAFIVRFFDTTDVLRKIQPNVKMDVLGRIREDKYSLFIKNHVFFVDPCTEYLYYPTKIRSFLAHPNTPEVVADYLYKLQREKNCQTKGFSKRRDQMHKNFWKQICEDDKTKINFVKRFLEHQMVCGVDMVIPPVPLITDKTLFKIAVELNTTSKEISRGRRPCASYFLAKQSILNNDNLMAEINQSLLENSSKTLTIFKFKNLDLTRPSYVVQRDNYRELMLNLAYLSREMQNRSSMVLENSFQAFASIFAGFDLVSSSFTMFDNDIGYSEHPPYGKYFDPRMKIHRKFDDMVETYRKLGRLPCPCEACREVKLPDLEMISSTDWYKLRRSHIPLYMNHWMKYVERAVKEKNTALARDTFVNSKITILKDLLP